jgi:hypothetical protein
MKHSVLLLLIVVLISGCQKIGEFYAGMYMQPNLSREDFKSGLNVYGVLKTGAGFDTLNHYFEVQKLLFFGDSFDTIFVSDADIVISRKSIDGIETIYRLKNIKDGIYLNRNIETAPGDRWSYRCIYDTFEVTASCTIPNLPKIKKNAERKDDNTIQFTVLSDSTACMYDVYLLNGENYFFGKNVPVKGVDSEFTLKPEWDSGIGINILFIFAYDENLEKYYTTSNTFFKPNAFRPSFSTVDGGYGTFGGISSNMVVVN